MSLDNFRNRTIIWDTVNKDFPQPIQIMQGDVNARTLSIKIVDNGGELDLTGHSLKLTYQYTNGSDSGFVMIPPSDLAKGEFVLVIPTEMTKTGVIEANLMLLNESLEQVIVSKSLTFISDNSTVTDLAQEVNNKIDDFTKLLLENMPQVMRSELNDLHAQTESNKNNIELKANLADVTSLQNAMTNLQNEVEAFGITPENLVTIKSLLDAIASNASEAEVAELINSVNVLTSNVSLMSDGDYSPKANQTDLESLQSIVNNQSATISTKATKSEVEVERSRINNIVASGTITEGNTELIDMRVGADGITYATAGESVRKQVSSLELTKTNNLFNTNAIVPNKRLITWKNPNTITGLYDGAGSYTTPILDVTVGKQYCFVSNGAIVTPNSLITSMGFDSAGNEIIGAATPSNKIYTIGSGVKYLRFTANDAYATDLCFKEYSVDMSLEYEEYGVSVSKRLDEMEVIIDEVPAINTRLETIERKDVTLKSIINKDHLNRQLETIGDFLCDFSDAMIVSNGQYFTVDGTIKKYVDKTAKITIPVGTPLNTVSKIKKNINLTFVSGDELCIMFYVGWDSVDSNTKTNVSPINTIRFYYTKADNTEIETRLNCYEIIRGWQMVKIPFTTETTIKAISLYVQSNVTNAITHDVIVNFDSAFKNYRMKPCVLLNFDNMIDENMYGVVYPLLESFGFKGTFYLGGQNALGGAYLTKAHIDDMVDNGWDYSFYGASGSTYGYDSDYQTAYNSIKSIIDFRKSEGIPLPISWFCQNGQTSNTFSKALKNLGFKIIRGQGQTNINYFGEDGLETKFNSLDATTTQNKLSQIKGYVDTAIAQGSALSVFTHQLLNTPDDTGINSTVEVWSDFLTYLKAKVDAGLIEVLTYSEFYERCVRTDLVSRQGNMRNMYRIRGLV